MDTSRFCVPAATLSRDLRTALGRARRLGIAGLEVDARGGLSPGSRGGLSPGFRSGLSPGFRSGLSPDEISQTGVRQIRKWCADEGVVVAAVAFRTRGGYADADRLEGRIAATKGAMKLARDLGAAVVVNHVGDIPPKAAGPQWRLLLDVLADLGAWGQRVGAMLCAEAGRAAPADLVRVIEALPEGSIACDLVTAALLVHGHDPVEAVATLGGHVAHVHATDAVAGAFAGRGRATILGTGQVDLPGVLAALEERGYRGWIGLEPVDDHAATAELADAIETLRAL